MKVNKLKNPWQRTSSPKIVKIIIQAKTNPSLIMKGKVLKYKNNINSTSCSFQFNKNIGKLLSESI